MEIITFLPEKENKLCGEFETHNFTASLAYLADVFSHLNDLNIALQGSEVTIGIFTMIPSVHSSGNVLLNQASSNRGCGTSAAM